MLVLSSTSALKVLPAVSTAVTPAAVSRMFSVMIAESAEVLYSVAVFRLRMPFTSFVTRP